MIAKPVKVPQKNITSVDITDLSGGLFLGGVQNAPKHALVEMRNVELDTNGLAHPRRTLTPFLPPTVGVTYQRYPVLWNGNLYYFTADDGKVVYCQEGDTSWTDCGGDNTFNTTGTGMTKFLRVLNNVLILNGKNGDKLAYVDLSTFEVVKYDPIDDPQNAPTTTLTGLSSGSVKIYYAINYSNEVGETKLTPIKTVDINHARSEWIDLSTPGSIKIAPNGTAPAGALYWSVYMALSSTGGTIQDKDMLLLAPKLDLSTTEFVDTGTLSIDLSKVAPTVNSTEGPRVDQGIVAEGRPILYGDQDNPYSIWIGGGGPYAMDFSMNNGGYVAKPEEGTNYYPTSVIGFRTGPGVPALTVLYSNTEGLSKQAVLEEKTVNYGNFSFTVWSVTEQHYGAAGVAAPSSTINYNGRLLFLSTDGFMSMETQPSSMNVLSTKSVSGPIRDYVKLIKNSAMHTVVGTGWNNKYMWLVPNAGFDAPQQILILDTNNKGINGDGAWYTLNIPAQWIGVISPQTDPAFVYVVQGNQSYRLIDGSGTYDFKQGAIAPYSTRLSGPLIPVSGEAHNTWQASVQAMFYLLNVTGRVTIGVEYRNQGGRLKQKTKVIEGPELAPSFAGGWGDSQWTYAHHPQVPGWGASVKLDADAEVVRGVDVRKAVRIDEVVNEVRWFISTGVGYNNYKWKAVSFEGINLGVRPDLS